MGLIASVIITMVLAAGAAWIIAAGLAALDGERDETDTGDEE